MLNVVFCAVHCCSCVTCRLRSEEDDIELLLFATEL